jgi:protein ImuB
MRFIPQNTHIPEFAVSGVAPFSTEATAKALTPPHAERFPPPFTGEGDHREAMVEGGGLAQDSAAPTRPLRLFERPEEIDAIAEVPDGPPARFKWRRVAHEIVKAEGPERIAMEWWRDDKGRTLTRDYFRVEDREGRRFWLYREGLFGREVALPRWFMHGLFA